MLFSKEYKGINYIPCCLVDCHMIREFVQSSERFIPINITVLLKYCSE